MTGRPGQIRPLSKEKEKEGNIWQRRKIWKNDDEKTEFSLADSTPSVEGVKRKLE